MIRSRTLSIAAALRFVAIGSLLSCGSGLAIEPWEENPWYWAIDDRPVMLLGGSDDDNLFQWPREKLIPQLDRIVAAGGNVIRNTMSDRKDGGFEVYPYLQLKNGKFDLMQWEPVYWRRFDQLLQETAERGIVVQIEVWDRFDFTDVRAHDPNRWQRHPYCPSSNINYTFDESGFAPRYPEHPGRNKQPFFFTTPSQQNNMVVLPFQQRFVKKLMEHSLPYDHVLYCIDNETRAEPEWGEYWAKFIRKCADEANRRVMVTEMWDDWDLRADRHRQTFDHPQLYDYVDVSQNNHNRGENHWTNFLFVRDYLDDNPRPMNTTKTYGADGNKFKHTDQDAIERFWRHLLAGAASIRFHRPDSGLGINDKAVACIRAARLLGKEIPFWEIEAANDLLFDRQENEAFAAASPKRDRIAIFFPSATPPASITLRPGVAMTGADAHWINIDTAEKLPPSSVRFDREIQLRPPGRGNFALAIVATP